MTHPYADDLRGKDTSDSELRLRLLSMALEYAYHKPPVTDPVEIAQQMLRFVRGQTEAAPTSTPPATEPQTETALPPVESLPSFGDLPEAEQKLVRETLDDATPFNPDADHIAEAVAAIADPPPATPDRSLAPETADEVLELTALAPEFETTAPESRRFSIFDAIRPR